MPSRTRYHRCTNRATKRNTAKLLFVEQNKVSQQSMQGDNSCFLSLSKAPKRYVPCRGTCREESPSSFHALSMGRCHRRTNRTGLHVEERVTTALSSSSQRKPSPNAIEVRQGRRVGGVHCVAQYVGQYIMLTGVSESDHSYQ